jgi:hypothetical protein
MKTRNLLLAVLFFLTIILLPISCFAQGTWAKKADFGGGSRYSAASFSIGTKAYVGIGYDVNDIPMRDFWEWDQTTNVWIRKADFPGNIAGYAVSFSIGNKGYIGTGNGFSNNGFTNEFWEYNPVTDSWNQKASLPGTDTRAWAVGFSIGTKGYIGLGGKDQFSGAGMSSYCSDFWEWDQATNVWTKRADYPGSSKVGAVGFSIGNKGYIGTGYNGTSVTNDFWEWDQATNVWNRKADFAGDGASGAVGFSIENKGYIGTGYNETSVKNNFWEWDQVTNLWTQRASYPKSTGYNIIGFSIGEKGYIGIGFGGYGVVYGSKDFWEYNSSITTGLTELSGENPLFYPNPASDLIILNIDNQNNAEVTLKIYNVTGELVRSELLKQNQQQIPVADLKSGIYMIEIKSGEWVKKQKLIIQ